MNDSATSLAICNPLSGKPVVSVTEKTTGHGVEPADRVDELKYTICRTPGYGVKNPTQLLFVFAAVIMTWPMPTGTQVSTETVGMPLWRWSRTCTVSTDSMAHRQWNHSASYC